MCDVAFVIAGVKELLWFSAVFVFMDHCVKYVMKLKHHPRFSSGAETQDHPVSQPCPQDRMVSCCIKSTKVPGFFPCVKPSGCS